MKPKQKRLIHHIVWLVVDLAFLAICLWVIFRPQIGFLQHGFLSPHGVIAQKELGLLVTVVGLMLIVVIPVFILLFYISWKYRADRTEEKYSPDMQSNKKIGTLLWAIPIILIFIIGVINWKSTHELDPYKPIASSNKPITIQVVALQWKWLFIYPEQNIATVNFVEFPKDAPVSFELTSDAPMNSFWIPELGGQMYAMAGMETHLHLEANKLGEFNGGAAEINGQGFAGMKFTAKAVSDDEFKKWTDSAKTSNIVLDQTVYDALAKPSENNPPVTYSAVEANLFDHVIFKFMSAGK